MAGPQNVGIPTPKAGKITTIAPQNQNPEAVSPVSITGPNHPVAVVPGQIQTSLPGIPAAGAGAGATPAAPATPQPLPTPDFNALTGIDSQYTTGEADLARQNQLAVNALNQAFATNSQGSQDNANAHGALFSGAAVNAQKYLSQQLTDQQNQQAANWQQNQHSLYVNVFNRLISQLAPAGTTQQPVIPTG